MPERYGETPAEAEAREMLKCRQIVAEISGFGVSQREILRIMHLLALELEDRETMVDLSERIKSSLTGSAESLSSLIVET
jgi:hypothetical protein